MLNLAKKIIICLAEELARREIGAWHEKLPQSGLRRGHRDLECHTTRGMKIK
jgi:hypothetical protein